MTQKDSNLINFDKEIKFQESKKIEDPFNVNNINFESINFHEESKENGKPIGGDDVFGVFSNIKSNNENNIKVSKENLKSEYDLGSLGIDFTAPCSDNNNNNAKCVNEEKSNLYNFAKEEHMFDLPRLQVDPSTLDTFTIREMCDPIINV